MIQGFFLRMDCRIRLSRLARALPATAAVLTCVVLAGSALAQSRGYLSSDPNVTVDLSVLGGGGNEPVFTAPLPGAVTSDFDRAPSGLLFPPKNPPTSRLSGQYTSPVTQQLRRPPSIQPAGVPADPAMPPKSRLTVPPPAAASVAAMPKAEAPMAPARTAERPAPPPMAKPATPPPAAPTPPAAPPAARPVAPEAPAAAMTAAKPAMPAAPPAPPPSEKMAKSPAAVPPRPALPQPSATPAPPPAAVAAVEKPAPVETAARSAASATPPAAPGTEVRVLFESGSAKLPDSARDALLGLVGKLEANQGTRLQIDAYAAGSSETASVARRLSLSRALSVRSYLIEQGVRSTRMDVRALGNKASDPPAPADRVDAIVVER